MYKNVASQYTFVYAHNTINDSPETGLSVTGLEIYITKDDGAIAESNATSAGDAVEVSNISAKGVYKIALTQAETNADVILITGTSDVAGVEISPQIIQTQTVMVGTNNAATETKQDIIDGIVDAIKVKTDGLNFTGIDVKATLDSEEVTTDSASRTASKADVSGILEDTDEIQALVTTDGNGDLKFIKDVIEGDAIVNTATTPWQLVIKIKNTETELIRKDLKDKDGNNITSVNAMIGRYTEPS